MESIRRLFFLLFLCIPSVALATTPTVSNVTGTIATGQTLTITGTYMVDENKTNWGTAYQSGTKYGFEGSSYTADGYGEAPDVNPQDRSYDSTVKLLGSKSFKGRIYGNSSSCPGDNHSSGLYIDLSEDGVGSSTDFYVRLYSRWDSTGSGSQWPTSHIKMLDVQGTGDQMYFQPSAGSSLPTQMNMIYDSTNHYYTVANFLQENRWYCMEARFKTSSPHNFTAWVDGVQINSAIPSSVGSYAYVLFNMINACEFSNLDLSNWTDGFTVSTSRIYPASSIYVSNNSTYGNGVVKYQEPVALSNTSSQIKLDLTDLGGGPYYLWVVNNRQEVSAGYQLNGTGGGDTTAPTVTITSADPASITTNSHAITGTYSDDTAVTGCEWRLIEAPNQDGMGTDCTWGSGTFTCTTGGYVSGANTAYVACYDAAANWGSDSITVNYTPQSTLLFSESFSDASFSARSWYDNTTHGSVVSGGVSGNRLRWAWTSGQSLPTNGAAMRKKFTPTDSLHVEFYVNFATGWRGSQQTYHPHMITIPSDLDDDYAALASNYLNTYIEFISDVGSPYTIRPAFAIQDSLRVNASYGTPPLDIVSATENRSACYCNTPVTAPATGVCYDDGGGGYYSATLAKGTRAVSTNLWHKVNVYLKMNTISGNVGQRDGVYVMLVDGVRVLEKYDMLYRTNQDATKKWGQFVLSPWIGDGSPITQTMYIDELKVYDWVPDAASSSLMKHGSGGTSLGAGGTYR